MATLIFDFDSTLVPFESLEEVLKTKNLDAKTICEIEKITSEGMSGRIPFLESLEKRLSVAPVTRQDFITLGEKAFLTPGMKELVHELQKQSISVWIVSGAVWEVMLPIGRGLGIPEAQILGVKLNWDAKGNYAGLDKKNPINRSKWEGAKEASKNWTRPVIAVGDGMTDYALFEHQLVDHFIAFTGHVKRQAVLDKGVPIAYTVAELKQLIKEMMNGKAFIS